MSHPSRQLPAGRPIDTFDELDVNVVARVGGAHTVDQMLDGQLAEADWEFVNGCRETYAAVA
jgi:hypothetical protein